MSCKKLLKSAATIFLLCVSQLVMAQDRVISGKVTDSKDGSPVVGASVQPKGAKKPGLQRKATVLSHSLSLLMLLLLLSALLDLPHRKFQLMEKLLFHLYIEDSG